MVKPTNKKILFISGLNLEKIKTDGVAKKLFLEISTLKKIGFTVDYVEFFKGDVVINKNGKRKIISKTESSFYKTMNMFYNQMQKQINIVRDYDILYIRYEHIGYNKSIFLKKFKKIGKKIIFVEIPTYVSKPYPNSTAKQKLTFYLKKAFNHFFLKEVDCFLTFSSHKVLYSKPTIQIENFADVDNLPIKIHNEVSNDIHLLALAQLSKAHGFDKVITGINEYYKQKRNKNVFLHVVGDGPIKQQLISLVSEFNLNNKVLFYGIKGGDELNEIFDKCDIGIGALAVFRKGSYKVSELKIREYTARCLPFVYNAYEPLLKSQPFCLKVPFNDEPVDIKVLVDFYENFRNNHDPLIMRRFAEENFRCENQLIKIMDYI